MQSKRCNCCKKVINIDKFYMNSAGRLMSECVSCYNFKRSKEFIDLMTGKKKTASTEERQKIADRCMRRKKIKKVLRG